VSSLPTSLRRQLESAIKQARTVASGGAQHALEALAVHQPDPYPHMNEAQRNLRRHLRAQARQLGDGENQVKRGAYEIKHLAGKLAYDQWHRLLFARYLLENNLLISPAHGVAVSLDDCEELAPSEGLKDAWAVAARFAAKELPEIFRTDDPAGSVEFSVNDRQPLIALVTELPVEVFTAGDSLGWCYQFWQAEEKKRVNDSGNKIGADELPAVTQLFTEDYMVDFLLDNTLGAWHAGKVFATNPQLAATAQNEAELRHAVALPGCPWTYLRFIQGSDGLWTPAAGTFDGWPKSAAALTALDPCMGSGHFVVALFERMVALRLAEEPLDDVTTVAAVIADNLFGLEIDPRCTQIAAFNLALTAWRRVGHCKLPAMNLACSGLAPNAKREDWLKLTDSAPHLRFQMGALYDLFEKAPVLGSLINPRADKAVTFNDALHELQPLLEKALAQETNDDTAHEMAVTARGLAKAAEILAGQFTLIATNVPYLKSGSQHETLKDYCKRIYPDAKTDLATCFVERGLEFSAEGGSVALVTPQSWLFMGTYRTLRLILLKTTSWCSLARLGTHAFETIGGEVVNVALITLTAQKPAGDLFFSSIDAGEKPSPAQKAEVLREELPIVFPQARQLENPDARIAMDSGEADTLLSSYASSYVGMHMGDNEHFARCIWEIPKFLDDHKPYQCPVNETAYFGGRHWFALWFNGGRIHVENPKARVQGQPAWGKAAVSVRLVGHLPTTIGSGEVFEQSIANIVPHSPANLPAIWQFCSSGEFNKAVRCLDQALKVTSGTLVKVPFDLAHWQKVAAEKYPHGLPKPFSSDPTQWLFNGHPAGSDQPLHVAVARLLGYQWPRQTGSSFPDCPALGPDGLEAHADEDGIVCLSATKGEAPAAERLRALLAQAVDKLDLSALLARAGLKGSKSETLEDWLRDEFFEQHSKLFHDRPFIWHIWDGLKNGFSALVNYHKLDHANLEKLTYAYLGDWIRRQQTAVEAGEAGSDAKLQAAKQLQATLKLILEGEPPYDIFVRWKPLSKQAIGWEPDLNDGVRMNIRPFLNAPDVGKKGAGILRVKPTIKWDKDRGKEPLRDKKEFPWFWNWDETKQDFAGLGKEPDGNRWNDCHYGNAVKQAARATQK